MKINRENIIWLVIGALLGIISLTLFLLATGRTRPAPIYISPPAPTVAPMSIETPGPMRVYVSGEVLVPMVYELPRGSIVQDAVIAAGGFNEDANKNAVNLALSLSDGMHVHVPGLEEPITGPLITEGDSRSGTLINITVNLNTATLDELQTLPGIGPSTAQKIIDYRQAMGPFQSVADVVNVSGIGTAKYEQIKDLVSVR